jgi:amino acid adenylation domain-containing protein
MADLSQPAPPGPGKGFRSMLDRLREKREAIAPTRISRIARSPEDGGAFPLSFGQQRLWFLEQLQPGNSAYSIFSAVRLRGPLDARALALSFSEIVRRHESLRTTFRALGSGDTPMQIVSPPAPFPVPVVDLSACLSCVPHDCRDREVRRLALKEAGAPFDLANGPLLRVTLLRLSAQEHVVLLNLHHIISDGWSLGILIREMTLLYESFVRGLPSPLPELSIQYADYAQWQRETLQGETLETLLEFWRKQLGGSPPALRLPGDRPRPPAPSFRGASIPVAFSGALRDRLLEMGRREGSTLFTILLAAFQTLLYRYSGQVDLWVGAPVANRKRAEIQDLIGFFVNTLVMRGDLSGSPTFRELLSRLREMSLEAYSHQDLPFEKVVEELQPERSGAGAQLLQAVLAFDTAPEHTLSEIELTVLPIEREASPFELTFNFVEGRDGFGGVIEYSTDLFDTPTIGRMAVHFETLLLAVAVDPSRHLAEIPLLGGEEQHQLLFERNDTQVEFPRECCVHEIFDQVAETAAERTALACGGESLTYGELRRQADRLALFLRRLGVGPEVAVAVCLERSVDSIVALLAVLKAGGAYLPLDPAYPAERLAFMLEDSQAPVLLTSSQLLPVLPAMEMMAAEIVCLDRDREEIARLASGSPLPSMAATASAGADNLAYIMFTSGSTGRPKGVGVTHRNIVRLVRGANYVELGPAEVLLQLAPISFDAATLEIWGALLNGGRLEIFPPGVPSLDELGNFLVERAISVLWLTAGLFHQMVEVRLDSLGHVRQLLAGGDALSVPHVRRVLDRLGADSRLINGYGPTEGTTFSCCNPMRSPEGIGASVPIGRPISNARAYILDPDLRLVPGGVPGELYIGGDGLARGYLGRPGLTAERFVPDGFGSAAGERLYRTGDLVRSLPDGSIEFLGRIDQQVKIRGFRVELGEVEAALARCPGVSDCAVMAREDLPGGKQLVGYVVPEAELATDAQALRHVLQERLPEYMIPSALVFLDALPLTPNGKVDRRALPAPTRTDAPRAQAAARTPLEELLAGLWAEVLDVPEVGLHDDFFELGGHSLLATRLMSRVRAVFAVDVPLRELFESPTVVTLAAAIEATRAGEDALAAPPMARVPRGGSLPLSFAQERLWFLDQFEPDSPAYNVPFAVSLRGRLSPLALEHGLHAVIERHETLRTTFREAEGRPVLEIAPLAPQPLPVIDLSGVSAGEREAEAHRLAAAEARRPLNLLTGPLLRAGLIRMAPEEHLALLTLHHIVSDAWSMEILIRDLGAFYRSALESSSPDLPELPIQYADFSAWQRQWLQGDALARELGFWRSRLESSPSVLDLPTDRLRSTAQTFRGSQEDLDLPAALGEGVAALARREGVTVFMIGLAAFNALVYRYTGQPAFNVGTPIAGRNHLETENLIGFFVNTLVLPAGLSGDSRLDEVLAGVREITLAAHAHQELPFERLVEELEPERSLTHSPLFQVMFVLRNMSRQPVALANLESDFLSAETGTTKFDLILSLREDARNLSARYKTDLFDDVTVKRLLGHYRRVLEGMVEEPRRRISDLPLLSEMERRQVLEEWNDTAEAFPPDRCLHELFEEQVERTPETPAVIFEGSSLTYRELNQRANRLAGFLRGRGVGPEVPVGLFLERSLEMVVALYGVLKAGGLYVALAPNFPRERLAFMFEEARVPVLLTQRRLAAALPEVAAEVVCLDAAEDLLSGHGTENPVSGALSANAAYMIYTSGSTGRPKGVVVEHRQIVHYVRSLVALTGLRPGWTFAALQSPAVDSSKSVLFPALLTGGCLHMISEERATDAHALGAYLARERIDVLKIAPSHLGALMSAGEQDRMLPRRLLVFGGEPSTREWASRLAGKAPDLPMYSNYGPTETTVGSSMYRVRAERMHDVPLVPLGRAFPNTRYYLLDWDLRPVPMGVPGELYIGGRQVTRGYLHRLGLTAERFLPDPFSPEPGARMYRSGDRARYLPDGQLESLGRTDHQIKVRGFRVELGEIESVMGLHPGVEACAVSTWEEHPGDRRLAGFVVAREEGGADATGLREFLREHLPEYMVPSVFVFLDELPRSVHGKVDRQALVVPAGLEAAGSGESYEAPRTAAEQRLAELWGEVLGRQRIGVHDNFFELGGHSLLATRLVSRIRDAFQTELPLRRLFEQPTVAGLAAELETAGSKPLEAPAIEPIPRDAAILLSFAQERLWFLDQLLPGNAAYNIPAAVLLKGRLSIPVLRASLDEIIRRHEVLRTTFPLSGERPVQHIAPPAPAPLPLIDLSGLDGVRQPSEAGRLCDEEARRPFDLVRGPLVRAALLRLQPKEHLALFTLHHIVSDGWSTGVLVRETAALYEAFSESRPSPLPELPVQYADFSAWQRRWLQTGTEEAQLDYWRERLRGAPPAIDLPTDRPRPVVPGGRGGRGGFQAFELTAADADSLRQLARREDATLFMVFLAGLDALLARYSGQTDLLVGTPIAGRNRSEIEPLIGFFVNTLVLRVDLSGEPSAGEALARVRTAGLEAYARQDLPFERLVEALTPERSLGRSPLFQVLFAYQNTPRETLRLPDLSLSYVPTDAGVAKFDLSLTIEEDAEVLRGAFSYSRDLFEAATVERMIGHLQRVLRGMAEEPGTPLFHLPLLAPAERQALLVEWNDTWRDYPRELTLHGLVERQADRTPDALAVVCGDARLTYGELERSANRLAHRLSDAGVRRGDRVGIALERSPEMVVALLAVLKSGAAYVPVDPEYPAERVAYMLEDSGVELLLSSGRLDLPPHSARVLDLDDPRLLDGASAERPGSGVGGSDLAYVIYTSGSTGHPKGAMLNQQAAANQMLWLQETLRLTAGDRVFQKTAFSFDASVWEFYAPLLAGATLVLARPGGHRDPEYLIRTMREHGVTILQVVPSLLRALLEQGGLESCRSLRMVFCGAESLVPDLVDLFFRSSDADLINVYGPAETAIQVTSWHCRPGQDSVPIGRPLSNSRLFIATRGFEPAPTGVPGELLIGGRQVCRGYLGAPALTAEKFVPDPFSASPGARLYRTGDRGRVLPDGLLEFLGRIDNQVKVRGFRIELGEIESVLTQAPGVARAVVLTRGEHGDQLAACIVAEPADVADIAAEAVDAASLRSFVRERLPEHMVPSSFLFLEDLPLSPSGKVDRGALQALDWRGEASGQPEEGSAPRTPTEEILAGLWAELLDREEVGIRDSFFELGGHSLLATRVASRAREAFGVELPLWVFFETPTIEAIAAWIDSQGQPELVQAPPIRRVSREGLLPLSFAQERLWFIDQLQPGGSVYSIPAALRLAGQLDVSALRRSFLEVVRRHEALRTSFGETDGAPFQKIAAEMAVELPVTDLRDLPETRRRDEAPRLLVEEVRRPFDLSRGPLMRLRLIQMEKEEWLLLLNLHHIVSDGWSMGVLIREVIALYGALSQGKPSPLADLPVQYADFAVWQREWLRGEVLEARLGFWQKALAGSPELLELPTDRPRPAAQSYRGGTESMRLSPALSRSLRALAGREGATLFMVLLAGFQELLRRHTHQEDLLVGSPIANRNRTELEGLIGFFVNTLVLRRPTGAGTFRELLSGARRFTLQAYAHQDVPFEKLVEALDVERSLAHSPLFQAMFVLQNNAIPALSVPGLELSPVELPSGSAKFDLHLGLGDSVDGGLAGSLVYAAALFEPATARRLLERFEILLAAAVADPGRRLSDLPVLTPAELDQLRLWDGTAVEYEGAEACLHDLIAAQIERTPEAVAVVFEGESLTYRELGRRSGILAGHLRSLGVGPETLVGICAERSLEMIVGLLGILRAGGAYVPLDPGYPADRLAFMLEDSSVPVLLAQSHLLERLPEHGARTVVLDALPAEEAQPAAALPLDGADFAAYAIFTSGSTGRPKGAVNTHRGIVNRLLWMQRMYGLKASDRVLQKTPFSFDVSVWELFWPLMTGARLVMARPGGHQDPSYLVETIEREGITTLHFVPSMLQVFVEQEDLERCSSLRRVIASGEALPADLAQRFFSRLGHPLGTGLHNLYGPTEAAVDVTYHACVPGEERVPIGRPVANTRLHLVDRELREVPVGAAGELCIGGVQVGRGYLRRPELTADRFVPDPFGPAGARLYRTGDLARWLPNGEVEYLGRIDHQVKIRGFRIELGEIEAALARYPGVREAVVLARGEGAERSLVAYLVPPVAPVAEKAAGLREHLRASLPEHMIPSVFVFLEAMPLSPNGKVDRKALTRERVEIGKSEDDTAPRNEIEQRLADLWREVLGRESIGIHSNFFAVGGHSLLAVRLIARIRRDLGRSLPLGALFQGATIGRMAALLAEDQELPARRSPLVALQPRGSEPPFFFVHAVGGHVFSYVDLARAMGDEQPFYGLQVPENGRPAASIEEMAAQYVEAVRSVQPEGPYRLGGWSLGGVIAQEMALQLWESGRPAESLVLIDSFAPGSSRQDGDVSEASLLARFASDLARLSGKGAEDFDLADLGEDGAGALGRLFARAEARGLVPPDLALQDAEALFEVFRANFLAVRSFRPRFYPGRLLLVRATQSPADHGWEGLAQEVEIEDVAGDHYSILRNPNVERLADLLKLRLEPLLKS